MFENTKIQVLSLAKCNKCYYVCITNCIVCHKKMLLPIQLFYFLNNPVCFKYIF